MWATFLIRPWVRKRLIRYEARPVVRPGICRRRSGAEAGDGPLAAREGEEQPGVGVEKEVEAAVGAVLDLGRCRHLGQRLLRGVGVVETGHEGEIAVVGGVHEFAQVGEAVDRDLRRAASLKTRSPLRCST